jgi:hypothetical protein
MSHHILRIRATAPSDRDALADLTALGPRPYLAGHGLVAEVDGTTVAAISLTTGAVTADVGRVHPRMIRALRYRRYQILRQGGDVGRAQALLRRLAPQQSFA